MSGSYETYVKLAEEIDRQYAENPELKEPYTVRRKRRKLTKLMKRRIKRENKRK